MPLGLDQGGLDVDVQVGLLLGCLGAQEAHVDSLGLAEALGAVGNLGSDVAEAPVLQAGRGEDGGGFVEPAGLVEGVCLFEDAFRLELDAALGDGADGVVEAVELEQGNDAGVQGSEVGPAGLDGGVGRLEDLFVVVDGGGPQEGAEGGGGV